MSRGDLAGAVARLDLDAELARRAPAAVSRSRRSASGDLAPQPARRRLAGALAQRDAGKRRRQRDLVVAERHLIGADRLARDGREQLLGHRHQRLVVGVRLVELHHRELGVVLRRDPLVPEVAVDLEHPLDAADGQPLQIELGRDAQVEIHVERVVMRHERPRQRAAGDRLHHRRLDLEVAARGHELANRRDDAAARSRRPGASRG